MAKIVKKKRKLRVQVLVSLFLVLSGISYLGSITLLRSINVSLSAKTDEIEVQLNEQKEKTATLENEVKQLSSSDRIAKIAEENDLKAIQSNVKMMSGEE